MDPFGLSGEAITDTTVRDLLIRRGITEETRKTDARAKRTAAFQKSLDGVSKFETDGWYRHDNELKLKKNELIKFYTDNFKVDKNPDDASDLELYRSAQSMKDELERLTKFSKQLKDNYKSQIARLEGKQDDYTQESIDAFNSFYALPLSEQTGELAPTLKAIKETSDWFTGFQKIKPSTRGSQIEDGNETITSRGANAEANAARTEEWFNTRSEDEQADMIEHYGDKGTALEKLTEDLNSRAAKFYGLSQDEYVESIFGNEEPTEANPLGLGSTLDSFGFKFGNRDVTSTREYYFKTQKAFPVNPKNKVSSSGQAISDNTESTLFTPIKTADYNVALDDATFKDPQTNKTYRVRKGRIVPDEWVGGLRSAGVRVGKKAFVEGIEKYTSITKEGKYAWSVQEKEKEKNRTVYIPLDEIEANLNKNIKGYSDFRDNMNQHPAYQIEESGTFGVEPEEKPISNFGWRQNE